MLEARILTQNFTIIAEILTTISLLMGIGMIMSSLFLFKKHGESKSQMSQQTSIFGPLSMLLAGTCLTILPTFIKVALFTFWGDSSPLAYDVGANGALDSLMPAIILIVRVMGIGAFIRGVILLSRAGSGHGQQGTLGKALIMMFCGILCVHIIGTTHILKSIMGVG